MKLDRSPDRLPRGVEDGKDFVPALVDELPTPGFDLCAGELCERRCQLGGSLVSAILGEGRVAANVGDQESLDPRRAFPQCVLGRRYCLDPRSIARSPTGDNFPLPWDAIARIPG